MSEILPLSGPVDLEALDQFLMSDASPEDCMQLSDLDGFLTGIAIGPELVMPSEWLPAIWGGEEPVFEDEEQARTVLGAIMGRYNEILHALNTDPEAYEPVFWEGPDGEVIAADWAEGFVDAIRLRPEAWRPLLEDPEALRHADTDPGVGQALYGAPGGPGEGAASARSLPASTSKRMVAGKADQGAAPCGSGPSFSPPRSCWRRSPPGPPTSSSGGRRGSTPRRTRRSGRSSPPSSRRPASRSSSSSTRRTRLRSKIAGRARGRDRRPTSCSALDSTILLRASGPTRVGSSTSRTRSARFAALFDRDALDGATLLDATTGRRGLYALPMGRYDQPRPRLEEPARAGRLHARRHPQGVGGVLVLLVRQGPAGRAQGHWPRRHLGRRPADVGRVERHRRSGSGSSCAPTRRTT